MSKSPLIRDTLLGGELNVMLVGYPNNVYASIGNVHISAKQLRDMADQIDRMEAATVAYFDLKEYAVNYSPSTGNHSEDSVIIKASSEQEALLAFDEMKLGKAKSIFNRNSGESKEV